MEDVEPGSGGCAGKPDERPSGVGRRVCPLLYALEVGRRRVGLPAENDDVRCIREGQERRHQTFDVAPDARCGRGKGATIDADSQLISMCNRRTGRLVRVQISRMRVSTLPLIARLLRITSSTPYWRIVVSRLSIEPRTGTPTIQR